MFKKTTLSSSYPVIKISLITSLLALSAFSLNANATKLTFDAPRSVGTTLGTSYGDRVSAASVGVTLDGGATPNIVLDFVPLVSWNPDFEVYSSGYSGLSNALGDTNFNVPGYVELIADAGWDVVLEGFQLGAWGSNSYANSQIRIENTAGTIFFDSGLFTFPGNTVYSYPASPIRSSTPLRIYIRDFGDLGLDNLQFSQVATVPDAETYSMMMLGLMMVGFALRQNSNRIA